MFDLFSDIFARRDNVLTRMDARGKMIIAAALLGAAIASRTMLTPLLVMTFSVSTILVLGIPARFVLLRLAAPLGMVSVLLVLQTLLTPGTVLFSFPIAGREIAASWEGLRQGLLVGARVLGAVSVMLLLGAVTPAYKIFHALKWFGMPEGWVEIALLVYRYTFALLEETADVASAQIARLGYSSVRRAVRSMGILVGTVITRSIDQALRTHEAMVLRGYQGSIPFGPAQRMRRADRIAVMMAIALITACYLTLEWWRT